MRINILGKDMSGVQFGAYDDGSGYCLIHPDGRQERANSIGDGENGYIFSGFIGDVVSSQQFPNNYMSRQNPFNSFGRVRDSFGSVDGDANYHDTNHQQSSEHKTMEDNNSISIIEYQLMSFKHNTRDNRTIVELLKELDTIIANELKKYEEISKELEEKRKAVLDGLSVGCKYVVTYSDNKAEICALDEDSGDLKPLTYGYSDIKTIEKLTTVKSSEDGIWKS
jgi:hypothetical protein